jgi:Fic family protein
MKYLNQKIIRQLEKKLEKVNTFRPFPVSAIKKLQKQFQIEMIYHSNAIEGNSLTLKETFLVINEGMTVKGKPLKDHLEAKDHQGALQHLYAMVEKKKQCAFSEGIIQGLHGRITSETDSAGAGTYRNAGVIIGGSDHVPPDAIDVPYQMAELVHWVRDNRKKLHVIELSALLHHRLVFIHPFFDGNGRVARIVMNLLLMQKGFPLAIILKNDRKKYYRVLDQADKKNYKPLVHFIAQAVERSLEIYLKMLTPISVKKENFLELSTFTNQTPYSAKYLNLLARQGKLEAYKERRNWLTSQEAIDRYIQSRERNKKIGTSHFIKRSKQL